MNITRHLLIGTACAVAALVPAAAHAAPTVLSVEQRPFSVTAHEQISAWSSYDTAAKLYRLKVASGGEPVSLPIAGSAEPFDVDAGKGLPGAADTTQLVYSRCAVPGAPAKLDGAPQRGTDCDLYRYDLATGTESALRDVNTAADEREPSVDGDRVVFIRRERDQRNGGWQDVVRIDGILTDAPSRRLFAAGSRLNAGVEDVQLGGNRVAFVAGRRYSQCCFLQKLFLVRTSGRGLRSVYRAVSGGANSAQIVTPTFSPSARSLFWARTNNGSGTGNRYIRHELTSGRTAYARGSHDIVSTNWVGGATGALSATAFAGSACFANVNDKPESSVCRLVATGPLVFDARP